MILTTTTTTIRVIQGIKWEVFERFYVREVALNASQTGDSDEEVVGRVLADERASKFAVDPTLITFRIKFWTHMFCEYTHFGDQCTKTRCRIINGCSELGREATSLAGVAGRVRPLLFKLEPVMGFVQNRRIFANYSAWTLGL